MNIFLTGSAGFIGFHLGCRLLELGHEIIGIDSYSDYYSVDLKKLRTSILSKHENFSFTQLDMTNEKALAEFVEKSSEIDLVIHLAAQTGVRISTEKPHITISSNILSFNNLIEVIRTKTSCRRLIYASSSSVYGSRDDGKAFSERDLITQPESVYGASKICNEIMAKSFEKVFDFKTTGLRFFTVYGPYGRPDMAYFKFARLMSKGETIPVFGGGQHFRDFTFISDIVNGIEKVIKSDCSEPIYNLGCCNPVKVIDFIDILAEKLGVKAKLNFIDGPRGDVPFTFADCSLAKRDLSYEPQVSLSDGLASFCDWYLKYNQ